MQGVTSPKRLLSYKRTRHASGSESEEGGLERQPSLIHRQSSRQMSIKKQASGEGLGKAEALKKKQEQWDKDIPEVCMFVCECGVFM